jgi:hypothetical protein
MLWQKKKNVSLINGNYRQYRMALLIGVTGVIGENNYRIGIKPENISRRCIESGVSYNEKRAGVSAASAAS